MASEWLKIGDFARLVGCTPANIYRYAKAYPDELGPEMVKQGRFTVISPAGQDFIRAQMYPKTLTESAAQEQIQKLMAALSASDHKAAELQQRLSAVEGERDRALLDLGEQKKLLLESREAEEAKAADLAKAKDDAEKSAQKASEEATRAQQAIREAEELRSRLEAAEAREKALEDKKREFDALPFWKKAFWKG